MKKTKICNLFNLLKLVLALVIGFVGVQFNSSIVSAATYYETTTRVHIAKGISYETSRMVTDKGMLDVHVLKVPLDDPNITVGPVDSAVAFGLKETTTKLLTDNNAIAGINGDFFGMSGSYSVPLGTEISEGKITSLTSGENAEEKNKASLLIDKEGNPFIDYVTAHIKFFVNGQESFPVPHLNKTVDVAYPSAITIDVMENTADFDKRIANISKIVVDNDVITYISSKGETVDIPENGFIIMLNSAHADAYLPKLSVGQTAALTVSGSIDLEKINTAISGAGKLLNNGVATGNNGFVATGKHPRTAIGISQDSKTLILMVADGRTHSVGASHQEMADLMIRFGAYQAMHFDGGGSSAMAVRKYGQTWLTLINKPSEGTQRKVINALGVFLKAPVGEISQIVVEVPSAVIRGQQAPVIVYGVDDYYNRIGLDPTKIALYTIDGSGQFFDSDFYANRTGIIDVYATYDQEFQAKTTIESDQLATLTPTVSTIKLGMGGKATLSFAGTGRNGTIVNVAASKLKYEVYPKELGTVAEGIFTADKLGAGWIRCYTGVDPDIDLVETYIAVYATLTAELLQSLDGGVKIHYAAAPYTLAGTAAYSGEQYTSGLYSVKLDYNFLESAETQAAYAGFTPAIQVNSKPSALRVSIYGDNSLNWVRGKIMNSEGVVYNIDLAKRMDWTGWRDVDVMLPENISYPITIEMLYVVSLSQLEPTNGTVYFDNVRILKDTSIGMPPVTLPDSTTYKDDLNVKFHGAPTNGNDVTFMGALGYSGEIPPENHEISKALALNAFSKHTSNGIYFGAADISEEIGIPVLANTGKYRPFLVSGLYGIQLYTAYGGIIASDVTQWESLKNAILACPTSAMVIATDVSPLAFNTSEESQLFHDLLVQATKLGKKVFVVASSPSGNNEVTVKDGVRYIDLGRLYKNGEINNDFSVLRFRINGNDIKYSIEKVLE